MLEKTLYLIENNEVLNKDINVLIVKSFIKTILEKGSVYSEQDILYISKIERKFFFDDRLIKDYQEPIFDFEENITFDEIKGLKIDLGDWVFTIGGQYQKDIELLDSYIPEEKAILVRPLFFKYDENIEKYVTFTSPEDEMKAILSFNADKRCCCKSIPSYSYKKCCSTNLFFTESPFGVYELDIIDKIARDYGTPSIFKNPQNKPSYIVGNYIRKKENFDYIMERICSLPIAYYDKTTFEEHKQNLSNFSNAINEEMYPIIKHKRMLWVVKNKNGVTVKAAATKETKLNQLYDSKVAYNYKAILLEIESIFSALFESYPKIMKELTRYVSSFRAITNDNKQMILLACELANKKNYHGASYVLFPQIESMLRIYAKKTDTPILTHKVGSFVPSYNLLTNLIKNVFKDKENSEDEENLNEDLKKFRDFLLKTLTNEGAHSLNLRNELLHDFQGATYDKNEFFTGLYIVLIMNYYYSKIVV